MVQTIREVPLVCGLALKEPFVCVLEWNFFGPLVTVTLCGAVPVHFQTTVVPRLTLRVFGRKKLSPILTVLDAPKAGMATAPARAANAATSTRARTLFMWGS